MLVSVASWALQSYTDSLPLVWVTLAGNAGLSVTMRGERRLSTPMGETSLDIEFFEPVELSLGVVVFCLFVLIIIWDQSR